MSTPFNSVLVWEIQQYRSFHDKYTLEVNRRYGALSGKVMWDWDVRVMGMSQVKGITRPCKSPETYIVREVEYFTDEDVEMPAFPLYAREEYQECSECSLPLGNYGCPHMKD